MQKSKVHIRA